jgi:hypothetical protein
MIFITNQSDILGIQQTTTNSSVELNDQMFDILKQTFGVSEPAGQMDDDHTRKGLKERLRIVHASKSIFENNQLLEEFSTSYTRSIIKLSSTPLNCVSQESFF